jgi:hypothetical protein
MVEATDFRTTLEELIRPPVGREIGLEFRYKPECEPLILADYNKQLNNIRECERVCRAVSLYIAWLARKDDVLPYVDLVFIDKIRTFDALLSSISADLAKSPATDFLTGDTIQWVFQQLMDRDLSPVPADYDVIFSFVGAYQENPTVTRILAYGGTIGAVILSLTFGAVQLTKEANAQACRDGHAEILKKQLSAFEHSAIQQGRWTSELVQNQQAALRAFELGSATCRSLLGDMEIRVKIPPGAEFAVRAGPPAEASQAQASPAAGPVAR